MKRWFLSIFLVLLFFSPTQAQVVGLHKLFDYQHYDIDRSVAPTNGQGLVWNSTTRKWAPGSASGANASGYYVVTRATSAPTNAVNLGALSSGLLFCTVADGVCTFSIKAIGTDVQAYNATLASIAALTESQGGIQYFTADNTPAILAKGTAGQLLQMNSGATAPEWTSSLTGSFTFGNADTSAGFIYFLEDSDNGTNKVQLIGPASTADVVVTLPATTGTLALQNESTTGSANSLKSPATTGLTTITGPAAGQTRAKTVSDADATIVEIGQTLVTRTEFIPVGWMIDGAAAPDAIATVDLGTRQVKARTFAADSSEDVEFFFQAASDLVDGDSGTAGMQVKWRPVYVITNATAPASGEGVVFALSSCSSGDSDSGDCTVGADSVVAYADLDGHAQYDIVYGTYAAMTVTDGAAAEAWMMKLYRDHDHASDDYGQVVGLIGIEIKYQTKPLNDY